MKIPTHLWYKLRLLLEVRFGLMVLSLPASVCPSVCQSRACQHDNSSTLFKLRSPNLDQRYKTTWLCISLTVKINSLNLYINHMVTFILVTWN